MSKQSASLSHGERAQAPADFDAETVDEFAHRNRISRGQVYQEIKHGRLIARKCGSRTLILNEDAAAWRRSLPKLMPVSAAS